MRDLGDGGHWEEADREEVEMKLMHRGQRPRHGGRYVENGTVGCPRRGIVDIEQCYFCDSFQDLEDADGETYLYCQPPWRGGLEAFDRYRPIL